MSIAHASRHSIAYVMEEEHGVTPENPSMKYLRHTSCALNLSRDSFTTEELRNDRQISDVRTGTDKISGSIGIELSYGEFDELLEAGLGGTWVENVLTTGVMERSFTIERQFTDIGQYVRYRGCFVNRFSLSIRPNAMVTGNCEIVGLSGETASTPLSTSIAASQVGRQYDSYSGALLENGTPLAVVTGLELTLDNGINSQFVLFKRAASFVTWGRSNVTGTITAFFEDAGLIKKFLDESAVSLRFTLGRSEDGQYEFTLPKIRYTGAENNMEKDGPISISMPFQAVLDPVSNTNLSIKRIAA